MGIKRSAFQAATRFAVSLVSTVLLAAATARATVPTPGTNYPWMDYWDFADTNNWTTFLNYQPISFNNLSSSLLPDGSALLLDSTNSAWLNYNVYETNGWTNITFVQGSLTAWVSPRWSSTNQGGPGPGVWGRLVDAGTFTTNSSIGWWSFYTDPAGANLYFSAQTNGASTNYLTVPISWTSNQWHNLALNYSSSNTALYIDGSLATNGPGMTIWPATNVLTNGFFIGSDETGAAQFHGRISAFTTYSYPLDANTIQAVFTLSSLFYGFYDASVATLPSAPSTAVFGTNFEAITGLGNLIPVSTNTSGCVANSSVWITNVTAHLAGNGTTTVSFTIAGGSNGLPYDVFATTALTGHYPSNSVWAWMGQGYQCVTYTLSNMPPEASFLILGTPKDTDSDGLTDAFELLVSKTNPNNADTAGSGMSDGWQWAYFDSLQPASGDYDGDGVSNLDEYLHGQDPNKIQFYVTLTNQFSATNQLPTQLVVGRGVPSDMAVVLDSTNFSSAAWTPYNSNLFVNLGTNEGWHDVWVGLRGLSGSSVQTWSWRRANFDKTPPLIVVTNPVTSTVIRPMIQLQGYSPEPLASLYYDVTNAAGCLSNLQGFVTSQMLDTNSVAYTTNWIQCFDIDLTNGLNSITLHAADLAGNITTTNFSFTLDYSTATNSPVITLLWPQNNSQIAGTNFALRAILNDPTAQVTAQILDTNGCASTVVYALVERSGLLWAENVPLNGGTNHVMLTATDAAGNVTTTNINVIQSSLGLTVDDFSGRNLYGLTIRVTGALSDSSYTVWVNGVMGTNNGDGTWTAVGVPVNKGGTAVVQARAVPSSDNSGNGTASTFDMVNPTSPNAVDVNPEVDKDVHPYLDLYTNSWKFKVNNYVVPRDNPQSDSSVEWWKNDIGGFYVDTQIYATGPDHNVDHLNHSWPVDTWPTSIYGTLDDYWDSYVDEVIGTLLPFNENWEHAEVQETVPFEDVSGSTVNYTLNIDSAIKLDTGGKAVPHAENLFAIAASATERGTEWDFGQLYTNRAVIDASKITLSLGKLGADGILWKVLPDGTTVDVTPRTAAGRYGISVDSTKYRPTITANGIDLASVAGKVTPEFCAGQQVTLSAGWAPLLPDGTSSQVQWQIDPKFVNKIIPGATNASDSYVIDTTQLTNASTSLWWYGIRGRKTVESTWKSTFPNGQTAAIEKSGDISLFIPRVVKLMPTMPFIVQVSGGYLQLGDNTGTGRMSFTAKVQSKTNFYGEANWIQLVDRDTTYATSTGGGYWLDNDHFYNTVEGAVGTAPTNTPINPVGFITLVDNPGVSSVPGYAYVHCMDLFKSYLMFYPDPQNSGNIWVTLGYVSWGWSGIETYGSLSSSNVIGPSFIANDQFPTWTNIIHNKGQ